MLNLNRCAKINVKVLVILLLVIVALGASLFAARNVRRSILSKRDLEAGEAAFENKDWPAAYRHFREYLGRNPDDIEILKKYAKARLSMRPLDAGVIGGAIAAYRRVIQLDPLDEIAYEKLATIYTAIGNFDELAYIARARRENVPNDLKAPLWLAQALIQLNRIEEARQTLDEFIKQLEALPDKHAEYVSACTLMSQIILVDDSNEAKAKALEMLNRAVEDAPEPVEALASRARFYRATSQIPGISEQEVRDRLALARKDLEAADDLGTEDPRIRSFLCGEWMVHGELDRAAAELQAVESLTQETLEEHFFDVNDWTATRFILASDLARRKGAITEGASLADEALTVLTERRHRVQILPSAIGLYVAVGKVSEARGCLDEYLDTQYIQEGTAESKLRLAWLQALVAQAEDKPYVVIDTLQPIAVNTTSRPEMWGLLAEAYSRTDQTRRAVAALMRYLRYYPQDAQMTLQLARQYSKVGDWKKAFETAQRAESLNPTDIIRKLLRIEASVNLAVGPGQKINAAKLEELSAELAQLRQEHPDQVGIRVLQAIIAVYLGQPDKAESQLKQAIEECKEPLRAEMQLVSHYYRAKRMTEALSACQTACERHSEVAEPWLSLSELHVANTDYDSARSCLREGLNSVTGKDGKRSLSIRLALLELMQGDRATGIDILKKLAEDDEQEIHARLLLLGIREIQQDKTATEKLVGELKRAEGESGLWWRLHEASSLLSSDDWRSKQQDITDRLQYCIDSDPQWSTPALLLVGMYERLEDPRRVEDVCRQTLIRNPSATNIADKLLSLLQRQGRFSEAEKVLQQIEADPRIASAWHVRMDLGAGKISRAIDELKLRVSNDDQDANSRIQLARLLYQQTGVADQAFVLLKEAEAIDPNSRTLTAVKASILRAEDRKEEALRVLDDYVADHNDFNAHWMRAVYLTEEGEFERAEQDYQKLTTFVEQGPAGYLLLGNFYANNKKLDKAVAALEEGLNAYPDDLGLKRNLMKLLFVRAHTQDREKALEILATLEERLPEDSELMTIRAVQILAESTPQSLAAAREKLENAVKLQPTTAINAYLALIGMAMKEGEYETARDYAIRALGSNRNNPMLLSARANAELALGNTQTAAELAHQALGADPNNIAAILTLADLHRFAGDAEQAKQRIEQAEQIDPNSQDVMRARFLWLASQKRFDEIAAIGSAYLSAKEPNPTVILTAASILAASDSAELKKEVLRLYERAAAASLIPVGVRLDWASIIYQAGNSERAKDLYRQLLEQNPDNIRALNDLAWILQEHDHNSAAALELANRGLSIAPDNLHLLDTRGTILTNIPGRLADAKKDFESLVELSPSDSPRQAKSLFKLGCVCEELNDLAQARTHLEKASELDRKIDVFTPEERAEITRILQGNVMESGK